MKKVLILIYSLGAGGAEKSLVNFLNSLEEKWLRDNDVLIDLMLINEEGLFLEQVPKYVNIVKCPKDYQIYSNPIGKSIRNGQMTMSGLYNKLNWFAKKAIYKKQNLSVGELQWKYYGSKLKSYSTEYDVAIAYFHSAQTYYIMNKVTAKKKVVWIHNEYEKLGFNDSFERDFYSRADKIATISDRCVESFVKHMPEYTEKVVMVENLSSEIGVRKMAGNKKPEEFLNVTSPIILTVGRVMEQKGYDFGLKALNILNKKGIKFHWYIIGARVDGEYLELIDRMIEEYGLKEKVTFLGLKTNPYPYVKNCDVFFQPSRYEGKSVALDEAMILCRPIVAANYPTVRDSIEHEKNGLICDYDEESMAEILEYVLSNSSIRDSLIEELKNEHHGNDCEIEKYKKLILD